MKTILPFILGLIVLLSGGYGQAAFLPMPDDSSGSETQQTTPDQAVVNQHPMSGTYTIGGTDADFLTFSLAGQALESRGISDAVVFRVRPGLYEEEFRLGVVEGSSCDRQVVFEGESRDSTAVVLRALRNSLLIGGSDGISFRYLTLHGVLIEEGSSCLTFESNRIEGSIYATSGPGELANHDHLYRNNYISGGISSHKSGTFDPANPDFDEGLEIWGNTLGGGIKLGAQKGIVINDNRITLIAQYSGAAGIDLINCWYGKEIRRNRISVDSYAGGVAGIRTQNGIPERISENRIGLGAEETIPHYLSGETGLGGGTGLIVSTGKTSSGEVLIANNSIHVDGYQRSGSVLDLRALHIRETYSSADIIKIYHNSASTSGYMDLRESSALYTGTLADKSLYILNNSFSDDAFGYKVHILHPAAVAVSDYNYFGGGTSIYKWGNQEANSLEDWQVLSGMDEHSITERPLEGAGIKVAEVDIDIDGKPRPDPPSIGPVEYGEPEQPEPLPLIPYVECVTRNRDGSYTATFGYNNPNEEAVNMAVGTENQLNLLEYAGQPVSFAPGRHERVFHVVFEGASSLSWTLGNETVTADRNVISCESVILPVEPLVTCVSEISRTIYMAKMGYSNPNAQPVAIATGRMNRLFGQHDQGQPTVFEPGLHPEVFYATYTGNLMWTLGSERVMTSQGTSGCSPALQAVQPILECVSRNEDGTYTAHFGYNNPNPVAVSASLKLHNHLFPAVPGGGEVPAVFEPGRHTYVFSVPFRGQRMEWRLLGTTVRASPAVAGACEAVNARMAIEAFSEETISQLPVYPNPFSRLLNIQLPTGAEGPVQLRIYSLAGVLLKAIDQPQGEAQQIDLAELGAGTYILEIQAGKIHQRIRIVKH